MSLDVAILFQGTVVVTDVSDQLRTRVGLVSAHGCRAELITVPGENAFSG